MKNDFLFVITILKIIKNKRGIAPNRPCGVCSLRFCFEVKVCYLNLNALILQSVGKFSKKKSSLFTFKENNCQSLRKCHFSKKKKFKIRRIINPKNIDKMHCVFYRNDFSYENFNRFLSLTHGRNASHILISICVFTLQLNNVSRCFHTVLVLNQLLFSYMQQSHIASSVSIFILNFVGVCDWCLFSKLRKYLVLYSPSLTHIALERICAFALF